MPPIHPMPTTHHTQPCDGPATDAPRFCLHTLFRLQVGVRGLLTSPDRRHQQLPTRLAALLALWLLAGAAHAVPQCELGGEPVNPANGFTTAGKSGLMRCTDLEGPVRLREQTLQEGRFIGPARWVYRDGSRKEHSTNARGNRHGLAREWDAQGTLRREENLDDGQPVGPQKTYAAAGYLQRFDYVVNRSVAVSLSTLADGSLSELRCAPVSLLPQDRAVCGHQGSASNVTLYRAPGQPSGTVSYLAGEMQRLTVLNPQGVLVRSETVEQQAGQPARRIKRVYYPAGRLRSETNLLEPEPGATRVEREGVAREWAESGQLTQETRWAQGLEQSIHQWYLNGQPKLRQQVAREGRNELRTTESFWDNGKASAINVERNGRLWGWQRYFNQTGQLLHEDEHGERGVLLRRKHFNEQGALEREERFLEDGSRI